ncbi:hypothetical protein ACFQ0X_43745 [Streptomyces rectiviolaceus]|uniref:Integral membrane protein n=1 Tax=Streptomyces rectiviolaceus TaxID=332591 RepID=A0ABP6NM57_9ACTN
MQKPDPRPAGIVALTLIVATGVGRLLHAVGWPPAAIGAYATLILAAGIAVAILLSDPTLTAAALRPGRVQRRTRRDGGQR